MCVKKRYASYMYRRYDKLSIELLNIIYLDNIRYLADIDKDPRRAATQSPSAPRCLLDSACLRIPGVLRRIANHE